jgi:hypothetical protein
LKDRSKVEKFTLADFKISYEIVIIKMVYGIGKIIKREISGIEHKFQK